MSQFAITSAFRVVVEGARRQQVLDVVRCPAFIGTLLLAWISLRPFADLGELQIGDVSTGNEAPTMRYLRVNVILNDEACAAFYRNLVRDGVIGCCAVISALTVGDEVVACPP